MKKKGSIKLPFIFIWDQKPGLYYAFVNTHQELILLTHQSQSLYNHWLRRLVINKVNKNQTHLYHVF